MDKASEFVFETFLRLTSKTYPFGYEDDIIKQMSHIFPDGLQKDKWGNYTYSIGNSRTIFASHLDTVAKDHVGVTHVFDGNYIKTDGKTTLGADDKAGVTIMLWMIKNKIPGIYYFFIGEEVGCVGSGLAAKHDEFKGRYDRIISFDRRDTNSIITYQSSSRCCSNKFADSLCQELNKSGLSYRKDDGGIYTDSAEFTELIPECTNISVGYYSEHTNSEKQNIKHLIALSEACLLVNWENLPIERDITKKEYKSYSSTYSNRGGASYGRSNYVHSNWNWDNNDYKNKSNRNSKIDGYNEEDYAYSAKRKTRRGNNAKKSNSKVYYDNGSGMIDVSVDTSDKYAWATDKFISDQFTWDELETIKNECLDMSNSYDETIYEYLRSKVIDL